MQCNPDCSERVRLVHDAVFQRARAERALTEKEAAENEAAQTMGLWIDALGRGCPRCWGTGVGTESAHKVRLELEALRAKIEYLNGLVERLERGEQ